MEWHLRIASTISTFIPDCRIPGEAGRHGKKCAPNLIIGGEEGLEALGAYRKRLS